MTIAILTLGTRGDMQPFVALGLGLQRAGYGILFISAKNEEAFVSSFGLPYFALSADIQKAMEAREVQQMAKGDNPIAFVRSHLSGSRQQQQMMDVVQNEACQACQGADAILYHPGMANAFYMARQLDIPAIMASPFPVTPTRLYPAILFYTGPRLGMWYNQLTQWLFERIFWQLSKGATTRFWQKQGKPNVVAAIPVSRLQVVSGQPTLYGYSELLFARDLAWPANVHITGYWPLDGEPDWQPPATLTTFLANGPPPVYIGFGSIKDTTAFAETIDMVLEAVNRANVRAIVALGWNHLPTGTLLPANVYLLDNAPHSWLFPQMAAVVHHGGAGTTAAGLRAGKPTLIIPHTADQPAWGRRVYELGIGPKPIPRKKLSAENLASALQAVLSPNIAVQAAQLSEQLRPEQGVQEAVRVIDAYLTRGK